MKYNVDEKLIVALSSFSVTLELKFDNMSIDSVTSFVQHPVSLKNPFDTQLMGKVE